MSKLRETLRKQMQNYGGQVRDLSRYTERITTGSLVMDRDLGGGFPKRRITEIYGPPNTGKSTLSLLTAKATVERGEAVLLVDLEGSFDPQWAQRLGVPMDALDRDGNPLFEVWSFPDAESALQAMTDVVRENAFHLVVVDTIAKLSPKAEQEAEMDKDTQMARQAKLMTRWCRTIGFPLSLSDTTILALNQVREDIGGYGHGKISTGGNAFWHEAALRIQTLSPAETWDNGSKRERIDKLTLRWNMKKSKVTDFNKATHEVTLLHLDDGRYVIDRVKEVFDLARQLGLFTNSNGDVWEGRGNCFWRETLLGNGEANILAAIGADYDVFSAIKDAVTAGEDALKEPTTLL